MDNTATQPYEYTVSRPDPMNEDLVRRQINTLLTHLMDVLKIEAPAMNRERHMLRAISQSEEQKVAGPCPEPMDEMLMIALSARRRIHILSADTGYDQQDEVANLAALNQIASSAIDLTWCIIRRRFGINEGQLLIRKSTREDGKPPAAIIIADNPPPNIIKLMTGEPE